MKQHVYFGAGLSFWYGWSHTVNLYWQAGHFLFVTDDPYIAMQDNSFEESSLWQSQRDGEAEMLIKIWILSQ